MGNNGIEQVDLIILLLSKSQMQIDKLICGKKP